MDYSGWTNEGFKLVVTAQKKWFRLKDYNLLVNAINGDKFVNGIEHTIDQNRVLLDSLCQIWV